MGNHKRAGRLKEELEKDYIDALGSFKWVNAGILQYDSGRIILAAQDQGLTSRATLYTLARSADPKCRLCRNDNESPSHLLSQCETLLKQGEYTTRHNKLCSYIHWNILGTFNIDRTEKYWEHEPKSP